ncbi:hypothetical protein CROQUDRAFT_36681 [Cronartium quercuum f. sp. fusiforme G11]|uniref:Uncharacterized protein n=1 Tax=Cronartium quercuum f. sp. fusiforme G11 TaxID=708437 RepID=A0A9P6NSQ2_9BASI|nr:hypothetical protein CROQUDRAFT_36681 [Cronartium quercuum f. sp. fusiforme G11]
MKHIRITDEEDEEYIPFCGVYENPGGPILNTFQSLATVNRRIYDISRPRLWKTLAFPTSVPNRMSEWTEDFLFKHGDLVEDISITLTPEWVSDDTEAIAQNAASDNLLVYDSLESHISSGDHRGLSHKNTTKVLIMCPNIRSLKLDLPFEYGLEYGPQDVTRLQTRLKKVVSRLPNLQNLELIDRSGRCMSDKFIVALIEHLPSLKSLECKNVFSRTGPGSLTKTLGWHLAQLELLSSLTFYRCNALNSTWCDQASPTQLTTLKLASCPNLSFVHALQLVERCASRLKDLTIDFDSQMLLSLPIHPVANGLGPH